MFYDVPECFRYHILIATVNRAAPSPLRTSLKTCDNMKKCNYQKTMWFSHRINVTPISALVDIICTADGEKGVAFLYIPLQSSCISNTVSSIL